MKRMIFSFSFLLYVAGAYAQITLEECQRKTQDNYPLVHQYGLVEKTKEYNLENAAKGYLPQFALLAKASYQSDVTDSHRGSPALPSVHRLLGVLQRRLGSV